MISPPPPFQVGWNSPFFSLFLFLSVGFIWPRSYFDMNFGSPSLQHTVRTYRWSLYYFFRNGQIKVKGEKIKREIRENEQRREMVLVLVVVEDLSLAGISTMGLCGFRWDFEGWNFVLLTLKDLIGNSRAVNLSSSLFLLHLCCIFASSDHPPPPPIHVSLYFPFYMEI